jgi:hypothetical protein
MEVSGKRHAPAALPLGNYLGSSERSVNFHHTTFHIPQDDCLHSHPRDNPKFNTGRVKLKFKLYENNPYKYILYT